MADTGTSQRPGRGSVDLYISVDVEADGPVPGPYSMSSLGMCLAGRYDGTRFERIDPALHTFYAELRPISDDYVPEAAAISGLDRQSLIRDGQDPAAAMTAAAQWVVRMAEHHRARPVLVAYPLGFDWMWLYWYFVQYSAIGSPFGHSTALDIKTFYAARSGAVLARAIKRAIPHDLRSQRPHTHHALDDAMEQADLLANLMGFRPQLPALQPWLPPEQAPDHEPSELASPDRSAPPDGSVL